jgi:N-terminal acetyltransferase B complex catalytic subunit
MDGGTHAFSPRSGHVSAITVSPQHRRLGLASMMMDLLEKVSERDEAYL